MISRGSDQTARMRSLIWAFVGLTYHIVGNLRLQLIYKCLRSYLVGLEALNFEQSFIYVNNLCASSEISGETVRRLV